MFPTEDGGNGGLLLAQDAQLAQAMTLQTLAMYFSPAAGNVRLGIWDATGPGGGPGNIIVQTASFAAQGGWNVRPVSPTPLAAGKYWLSYTPSDANLGFPVARGVGTCVWVVRPYSAMPTRFPTTPAANVGACHWSIYAAGTQ